MKKRISLFLIALCCIFPSALLLSGCFGSSEHYRLCFYVEGMKWQSGPAKNEKVNMPSDPYIPDHVFDGWFLDEGTWQQPFDANSLLNMDIKSDINVYAKLTYQEECWWDAYTSNDNGTHTLTCSRHGEKKGEPEQCSAQRKEDQPDCLHKCWCDKCCGEYGEILDHNYIHETCTMCSQPEYSPSLVYNAINGGESYEVKFEGSALTNNRDYGVRIRSYYNDKPVTRIGNYAFKGLYCTYINIPETITEIGDEVFSQIGVESLKIPSGVTSIGKNAFTLPVLQSIGAIILKQPKLANKHLTVIWEKI